MVAISLYRGNLHKVPDVPRQWLMPKHTISLNNFKSLLAKREKALSLLLPPSNPNPSFIDDDTEFVADNGCSKQNTNLQITVHQPLQLQLPSIDDPVLSNVKGIGEESLQSPGTKSTTPEEGALPVQKQEEYMQIKNTELPNSDKGKKKIDLEEKLTDLNERKHKLVQMLKQILNAEEEIKKRNGTAKQVEGGESQEKNNTTNGTRYMTQQQTLLYSPTPSTPSPLRKLSQPSSLPTTTPLVAPSPVASGGSPVFRDHLTSP